MVERLDHGSLDFAVLLEPVDAIKYDFFSLRDSARWGLLMPADCNLAQKGVVGPADLCRVPLVFHRREGLQREITRWAQTERLPIAATYNVINGDFVRCVQSGLGYFLTTEDHLGNVFDPTVRFCPLEPELTVHHSLVWKRYSVFSGAAKAFLDCLKEMVKQDEGSAY